MLLAFEYDEVIAQGSNATLVHEVEEGKALLFFIPEGKDTVHQTVAEVPMGIWSGLSFGPQSELAPDKNVQYIATYYLPGERIWFAWKSDNLHRHAVSIDDGARHDLESPYRLFYATDTKKLYMNIAEMWQFIASPDITLLEGYQELINRINELEARIAQLEANQQGGGV